MTIGLMILPVIAVIPALIAKQKERGFWTFYVFGLLLWIVAVVVAVAMEDRRRHCPHCVETINSTATVCPHCRRDIESRELVDRAQRELMGPPGFEPGTNGL